MKWKYYRRGDGTIFRIMPDGNTFKTYKFIGNDFYPYAMLDEIPKSWVLMKESEIMLELI